MLSSKIQSSTKFYNTVYHNIIHCQHILSMNNVISLDNHYSGYPKQDPFRFNSIYNDTEKTMTINTSHSNFEDAYELLITAVALYISISGTYHILRDYVLFSAPSHVFFISNINNNASSDENQIHPLVVNLSTHLLTPAQYKLLCRGLKFCPSPGEPDLSSYQADLTRYHVRLKRYLHFLKPKRNPSSNPNTSSSILPTQVDPSDDENQPFQHQKFKNPSAWVPPPIAPLEFFISKNCLDLVECNIPRPGKANITK